MMIEIRTDVSATHIRTAPTSQMYGWVKLYLPPRDVSLLRSESTGYKEYVLPSETKFTENGTKNGK